MVTYVSWMLRRGFVLFQKTTESGTNGFQVWLLLCTYYLDPCKCILGIFDSRFVACVWLYMPKLAIVMSAQSPFSQIYVLVSHITNTDDVLLYHVLKSTRISYQNCGSSVTTYIWDPCVLVADLGYRLAKLRTASCRRSCFYDLMDRFLGFGSQ